MDRNQSIERIVERMDEEKAMVSSITEQSKLGDGLDRWVDIRPETGGLQLHIREWQGEGVPFVLVHGLSSNCRTWEMVARHLAAAGHRVITVDQRGHGLSDKPADGYDFATVTEDLARLLELLNVSQPVMVGQSWGGNVMLAFATRYPGVARQFWFVDGGFLDLQLRSDGSWESISQLLRPPPLTGMAHSEIKMRIAASHPDWTEEGIEATMANFETMPDNTIRPWLDMDRHMLILRSLWEQRPAELYPQLQEPVTIAAANEGNNPEWTERKKQQIAVAQMLLPSVKTYWFENTAHDIHVHRPTELSEMMLSVLIN